MVLWLEKPSQSLKNTFSVEMLHGRRKVFPAYKAIPIHHTLSWITITVGNLSQIQLIMKSLNQ